MPELPELEVVCEVLQRRVVGQTITAVDVAPAGGPIVVRDLTHAGFERMLTAATCVGVTRRGKFLSHLHIRRVIAFQKDRTWLTSSRNTYQGLTGKE